MEFSKRSSLYRLCLCCDDSFASVFEDKASGQYNIASLLGELLQFEVFENDGYSEQIRLSCLKTTDFKTYKRNCLKAMITYDTEIRITENVSLLQQIKDDNISNTESTNTIIKHESNSDDLDPFGNPLTKDECCLSCEKEDFLNPGVYVNKLKYEPGLSRINIK